MARQKKWGSETERKRAYRAQREAAVSLSIRDKLHAQSGTSAEVLSRFDSIRTPIIERPGALERYLLDARRGARTVSQQMGENPEKTTHREARALQYASWRWAGYHARGISSL